MAPHQPNALTLCAHCLRPVVYDVSSGLWIHAGFAKVDGHNGLYCSPEMWEGTMERLYATPLDAQAL